MPRRLLAVTLMVGFAACEAAPVLPPVPAYAAPTLAELQFKAVLIAGDGGLPVFDNAVQQVALRLQRRGMPAEDIRQLSARIPATAENGIRLATLEQFTIAVANLRPADGQGCLVFLTSHGQRGSGIELDRLREILSPATLDRALARGCGNAPTVVIASACYTGGFTQPPMARANRIILTAARADRPSFGCRAGRTYTVFDQCLLDGLDHGGAWQDVYQATTACVTRNEQALHVKQPSEPQAFFGTAVAALPLPEAARR